jgi:hypothetical protein
MTKKKQNIHLFTVPKRVAQAMLSDLFLVEIQYKGIFRRLFNLVTGSYFDKKETYQIAITWKTLI